MCVQWNPSSILLNNLFFSTNGEWQFSVCHQWWSQTESAKHCINNKRVCFPWPYAQFCYINALPTAIVLDKWLCTGRTGFTAKKFFTCAILLASYEPLGRLKYLRTLANSCPLENLSYFTKLGDSDLALEERNSIQEKLATKGNLKRHRQTLQSHVKRSKFVDETVLPLCSL